MKIISSRRINEKPKVESKKPERNFLLDKSYSLSLFREYFFVDLRLGREYRTQDSKLGVSAGIKTFNTVAICLFGIVLLYMVLGSIIFTLYTLKSRSGLDIFPNMHFFNF
jgi:hypothetical protein